MVDDAVVADELTRLRGRIAFARGSALTAHAMLLAAARGAAERDPRTAATLLIEAARAAWNAHDQDRYAEAAALLTTLRLPEGDPLGPVVATAIAIGDFVAGRPTDPVIRMRRGIDAWIPLLEADQRSGHDQEFVEASLALTGFTRVTCDDAAGLAVGTAAVAGCRTRGLVAWLPWALVNLSMTEALAGRHAAAVASATEGLRLAQDLDLPMAVCACTASLAWVAAVRGRRSGATSWPTTRSAWPRRTTCRRLRCSRPGRSGCLYKAFPKLGISSRAELAHLDLEELAAGSSGRGR